MPSTGSPPLASAHASKSYLRDGRAPIPRLPATSRIMSANRGRGTSPELRLRNALRDIGVRNFQSNFSAIPGRPDIAFPGRRLAVFVNGCFWHRCPHCGPSTPKTHVAFWSAKFAANKARDARKLRELRERGWATLSIWECRLKRDPKRAAGRVVRRLKSLSS